MLGAWSAGISQVCHTVEAVVLADALKLAACWP
jgi:hypothetical protein